MPTLAEVAGLGHSACSLTACRSPLHPGPCAGWRHTLHTEAPAVSRSLERVRVEKLNQRRVAKVAELKSAGKKVPPALLKPIKPREDFTPKPRAPKAPKVPAAGKGDHLRISAVTGLIGGKATRSEKLAAIRRLTKDDFDALTPAQHRAVKAALDDIKNEHDDAKLRHGARDIHDARYGDFGVGSHTHKLNG